VKRQGGSDLPARLLATVGNVGLASKVALRFRAVVNEDGSVSVLSVATPCCAGQGSAGNLSALSDALSRTVARASGFEGDVNLRELCTGHVRSVLGLEVTTQQLAAAEAVGATCATRAQQVQADGSLENLVGVELCRQQASKCSGLVTPAVVWILDLIAALAALTKAVCKGEMMAAGQATTQALRMKHWQSHSSASRVNDLVRKSLGIMGHVI